MKMTLQSWTWEYGIGVIFVAGVIGFLLVMVSGNHPGLAYLNGMFHGAMLLYAAYYMHVTHTYRTRGELPEFKEYWAEQRERKP